MLKRVSIQNFKSLKDVTLDLQKVNLLIGPNNSGKTNFLKALEFCYDSEPFGELFRKNKQAKMQFFLDDLARKKAQEESKKFKSIVFKKDNQLHISLNLLFSDISEPFTINWGVDARLINQNFNDKNIDSSLNEREFHSLLSALGNIQIFRPDPNKLIQPGPVGIGANIVNADASNLVGFLDLMLGKYRRTVFNRIESDLHTCISEFDEINLDDASLTEDIKNKSLKRIGLTNSKQDITYWADELSEGTLYFLALLCIINQPNPPKLLLLEEPEKGIHPRRIAEIINFIFGLVDDKDIQVIMTTHSPAVVDMFKDMPESVFIFDKDDEGATHVKNLQKDIIEPETDESKKLGFDPPRYLDGLGEAWKVGLLGGVPR
ncbi:AAA family ATPase [Spirosoma foliorum]|uniref:AAA family ATPase n=1 Tax=Spirosoma foliorum TaxID=2710596 RepID=A0A7G5GUX5_9BACT|nr:ATP-binding protein [Spirosoma foliorum]QMW02667.1 AAA family ATPase [Spirosoma foliorum]